ncbi:MAG: thiosulfate/3-mercaptopyruvate sulfurtransferase [Thermoplasmata archaeon]|nr:thiosulfate/3-mercaptopyruvate sulfurtransferase [Thermoplasmata archaeon]
MTSPLLACEALQERLGGPDLLVVDCRFDLADKEKGVREYAKGHVPGAYYAHVERDLSGPIGDGHRGRHPLPLPGAFARWCGQNGITPTTLVVAYDDAAGQWASRLWWLLRHYGHANVAVLDGGLTRWKALRLPLANGHEKPRKPAAFAGKPGHMPVIEAPELEAGGITLVDARAPERYAGIVEPVDKRAGHIPGAVNVPFAGNVGPDQRFLGGDALRARFAEATGQKVAVYCGSGVTSTHNVLAMELAGLPPPALYPGSWSEWSFPAANRPIETGPRPAEAPKP